MKNKPWKMKSFDEVTAELLKDPDLKRRYDALGPKYELISAMIRQRTKNDLTQKQLAKMVGAKQSAIARFESGKHNPTLSSLKKIADELGLVITIKAKKA